MTIDTIQQQILKPNNNFCNNSDSNHNNITTPITTELLQEVQGEKQHPTNKGNNNEQPLLKQEPEQKEQDECNYNSNSYDDNNNDNSNNSNYFHGFERCEIFERLWHRLQQLEKWRELAIRPETVEECHTEDLDLFFQPFDDYPELVQRCHIVRHEMNQHLPPIETTIWDQYYLIPKRSNIPNAGLGLFYHQPRKISYHHQHHQQNGVMTDQKDKEQEQQSTVTEIRIIPKGTILCYYTGHIHNFQSAKRLQDKSYLMALVGNGIGGDNILVDSLPVPHIKARYINDPLNDDLVNCKFHPEQYRAAVVSTKPIHPGDELYASYGELYWSQQSIPGRVLHTQPQSQQN